MKLYEDSGACLILTYLIMSIQILTSAVRKNISNKMRIKTQSVVMLQYSSLARDSVPIGAHYAFFF